MQEFLFAHAHIVAIILTQKNSKANFSISNWLLCNKWGKAIYCIWYLLFARSLSVPFSHFFTFYWSSLFFFGVSTCSITLFFLYTLWIYGNDFLKNTIIIATLLFISAKNNGSTTASVLCLVFIVIFFFLLVSFLAFVDIAQHVVGILSPVYNSRKTIIGIMTSNSKYQQEGIMYSPVSAVSLI